MSCSLALSYKHGVLVMPDRLHLKHPQHFPNFESPDKNSPMNDKTGLSVTKPVAIWNKPLKADFRELFKSLGKGAVDGVTGNWTNLAQDAVETAAALGLDAEPGQIAWLLIYRSLARAIAGLIEENQVLMPRQPNAKAIQLMCEDLDNLENLEVTIDRHFFEHPKSLPLLTDIQTPLAQWLQGLGLKEAEATSMCKRLPSYFPLALNDEWRDRGSDYDRLKESLETPFTQASERERGWLRYSAWLQKQVDEPMFLEAFSLKRVFVPLRAYFDRPAKDEDGDEDEFDRPSVRFHQQDKKVDRIVVGLEAELEAWMKEADPKDAIRVISGGPGSGKSSFSKIWAAKQAETGTIPVLFVPLHQFDPTGDLVEAVGQFVRYDPYLTQNPLHPKTGEERLLVIFDGLDELAMQGKQAAETGRDFVREVQKQVGMFNLRQTRLQVLLSGRELAVQENRSEFRKPGQVLHILPYFVPEEEREDNRYLPRDYRYVDKANLLARDNRQDWWQRYGTASGRGYTEMPQDLGRDNLVEITSQPLLNYLVALSFTRGKVKFSKQSNLNTIYADLLAAVYERGWADKRQHPALVGVEEKDFIRILEEIALAAWHGDGRTTTVLEIESHCENGGLKRLLAQFQEGAKSGVTRLLTAFYFRQSGHSGAGDKTFEFTHKSFGEYLTARRIVREVGRMHKMLDRRRDDPDDGWDEREALRYWAILCGSSPMDGYLFGFLKDEIRLREKERLVYWQSMLCELIEFMLRHGMPMELLDTCPKYQEKCRQARNAEEALLVVLNACARVTRTISKIDWPSPDAAGNWIHRLRGQRRNKKNGLALTCLSRLDLSSCILYIQDLYGANLVGADLRGAILRGAILVGANLQRAILVGANLERADLVEVNLEGANLQGAKLLRASLQRANLQRAILNEETNFEGANLTGAKFDDDMQLPRQPDA